MEHNVVVSCAFCRLSRSLLKDKKTCCLNNRNIDLHIPHHNRHEASINEKELLQIERLFTEISTEMGIASLLINTNQG